MKILTKTQIKFSKPTMGETSYILFSLKENFKDAIKHEEINNTTSISTDQELIDLIHRLLQKKTQNPVSLY